jgi:hypothetical protein
MSNDTERLTQEQLSEILHLHRKWIYGAPGGVRANLSYANLFRANLSGANLSYANLSYANLFRANLSDADLLGALLPEPILDLTDCKVGYKKVWDMDRNLHLVIELRFPDRSKLVSTVLGRKCRASEAVVGRCMTPGHEGEVEFWSLYADSFIYRTGETVKPVEPFDDSITVECTSGIHFFTTREEAEAYRW